MTKENISGTYETLIIRKISVCKAACMYLPLLFHLLEGLWFPVATDWSKYLNLLSLFFLLHDIRVNTPAPVFPFSEILKTWQWCYKPISFFHMLSQRQGWNSRASKTKRCSEREKVGGSELDFKVYYLFSWLYLPCTFGACMWPKYCVGTKPLPT